MISDTVTNKLMSGLNFYYLLLIFLFKVMISIDELKNE